MDRNVKFIVSNLTNTDMNDDEKEKLIHDYILSRVTYKDDTTEDDATYNNAYSALYYGKTQCEGYAMLTYKMLKAAGIDNIIVTGGNHAWNIVKINNKWYHLDTTWNDGKRRDDGFYKYYNLNDADILTTHTYSNTTGILCTSNYIDDLTSLNTSSNGKYQKILNDIQKVEGYAQINTFKSNSSLNLVYTDVVLKEGDQTSLISNKFATGFYDNAYAWNISDSTVADVINGVIVAKKAGKATIAAVEMSPSGLNNNLFATIQVVTKDTQDGKTAQALSESNITGFTNANVIPQIKIHSSQNINTTTTATNNIEYLKGKVELIGEPIDVRTTSNFDWADVSFKLSQAELSSVNINDLMIFWYDEATGTMVPQATKVDVSTGTVSATVTHFSNFLLSIYCENSIDIAVVIDSYYGSDSSLATIKTNVTNTMLGLRRNSNVRIAFVDNNTSNPKQFQYAYFTKKGNPTQETINEVVNDIKEVFGNITAQNHVPADSDETMKICTSALSLGRIKLMTVSCFPKFSGCTYKNYVLPYTQWRGYFVDNNSIILEMPESIGLIVGQTIGYYEDQPIAYNQSNVVPLVKFLMRGDSSLVTLSNTHNPLFSWEMKQGIVNTSNDVCVLQKALIMNTPYLNLEGKAFYTYDIDTTNAVIKYQAEKGMVPNGVTDINVWKKLGLPWDDVNECPLRTSYDYLAILNNNNFYLKNPSVELTYPCQQAETKLKSGQNITVTATGSNIDHMALVLKDSSKENCIVVQNGTILNYGYAVPSEGSYQMYVLARNCPGSFSGTLVKSLYASLNVTQGTGKVTRDLLISIGYSEDTLNDIFMNGLNYTIDKYIIDDCTDQAKIKERIAKFIAQISVESGYGRSTVEQGNITYFNITYGKATKESRMGDIVNEDTGLRRYCGGGYIQLSTRGNYAAFAEDMGDPEIFNQGVYYVAENYSWQATGWWWKTNSMNSYIDSGHSIQDVSIKVNGGTTGLSDRVDVYNTIMSALNN